jgi:hypothetical protein
MVARATNVQSAPPTLPASGVDSIVIELVRGADAMDLGETQTQTRFDIFTIELSSKAQVGDMLLVDGITSPIQPADPNTPCDAPIEPMAFCNVMADSCHYDDGDDTEGDDTENVGCMSAGGGTENAVMLLVLGAVAAGRRARRSSAAGRGRRTTRP